MTFDCRPLALGGLRGSYRGSYLRDFEEAAARPSGWARGARGAGRWGGWTRGGGGGLAVRGSGEGRQQQRQQRARRGHAEGPGRRLRRSLHHEDSANHPIGIQHSVGVPVQSSRTIISAPIQVFPASFFFSFKF